MLQGLPLRLTLAGLLVLYVGERALGETARFVVSGAGLAIVLAGCFIAFLRLRRAEGERRLANRATLLHYLLILLGIGVYAVQSPELALLSSGTTRTLLNVIWPGLILLGVAPAIALELTLRSTEKAPKLELWRIKLAARAATIIALGAIAFAGVNYASAQWNHKIDLSYFKPTKVGSSNAKIVEGLTEPLRMMLFFPPGNEVLDYARSYVDELAGWSSQATVEILDHAAQPTRSKELKVRANGYLVIATDANHQTLRLGLDIEAASATLRRLDAEIQERLLKVLRPARIAYLTTGHLERDYSPPNDDKRQGLSDFRQILETLGFKIKRLGLTDGLGSQIPDDASVVIVAGPIEPFLEAERTALHAYLNKGGRAMILLDPDHGTVDDALLAPLGLTIPEGLIAADNPRYLWPIEGRRDSRFNIATIKTERHASTEMLSKSSGRLGVILMGSGSVRKLETPPADLKITTTLRSMPDSWADSRANGQFDVDEEKRSTWDLAAAVESRPASSPSDAPQTMRAVVFADADIIGDGIVRNPGNYTLVMDTLRWLAGDEATAGKIESEKDIAIVHRKDKDAIWFYGTSVLIPVLVLFGGLAFSRKSRRATGEL